MAQVLLDLAWFLMAIHLDVNLCKNYASLLHAWPCGSRCVNKEQIVCIIQQRKISTSKISLCI